MIKKFQKNQKLKRSPLNQKNSMISTKDSLLKRFADYVGINKKFSKRGYDKIDANPKHIISPVDATLFCTGDIDESGNIISKHGKVVPLSKLIGKYADKFHGGIYLNLYLSPKNKHYFVVPYDGTVEHVQKKEGKAFLPTIIGLDKLFGNQTWFSKAAIRNASIGIVVKSKKFTYVLIAVGSLNVNNITITCDSGKKYLKGDYVGHFAVGSTIILCLDRNVKKNCKLLIVNQEKIMIGKSIIKLNK